MQPEVYMSETLRLSLKIPVAIAGAKGRIWIADQDPPSLAVFDPASGQMTSRIALEDKPVTVSAGVGFVASGTASGSVIAFNPETGKELWRSAASSGDLQMKPVRDRVWVWDRPGASFLAFDQSGAQDRIDAQGVTLFAPGPDGVFWLSADRILGFQPRTQGHGLTVHLPSGAPTVGAMVVCANALWLSVSYALLLLDLRSLELRATAKASEGPVSHLICDNGRLFGGSPGVFLLDPAADAMVRPLPVTLSSQLRGLAVAGEKLWALESAEPLVHILDVP
jgi:streptogramin lyase